MTNNGNNSRTNQAPILFLFGLTVILLTIGVMAIILLPPRPINAPVEWLVDTYKPVAGCPGDEVRYQLVLKVKRSGHLFVFNNIVRANNHPDVQAARESELGVWVAATTKLPIIGDTVVGQRIGDGFGTVIILEDDDGVAINAGLIIDNDSVFIIPDLSPGPYVRNIAAGLTGVNAIMEYRQQRFIVRDDCE